MGVVPFLDADNSFLLKDFIKNTDVSVNYIINSFMRFLSLADN